MNNLVTSQLVSLAGSYTNHSLISPYGGTAYNSNYTTANHSITPINNDEPILPKPLFKMEFHKAHNGGFLMRFIKDAKKPEDASLYILKDMENIGKEIQNIMMLEVIKND